MADWSRVFANTSRKDQCIDSAQDRGHCADFLHNAVYEVIQRETWGKETWEQNDKERDEALGVFGVTKEEIREVLIQVAVYAGVPTAVAAFRYAREVFAEHKA